MHSKTWKIALLLACAALSACTSDPSGPANIGMAKNAATAYYKNGDYEHDLQLAAAPAADWIKQRSTQVAHPAIVFDIDETSLSNWSAIQANDYGYIPSGACKNLPNGPCGWDGWVKRGEATAIAPTRELYREAKELGITTFFISGRYESQRAITEQNLHDAGYSDWKTIYLKNDGSHYSSIADFKSLMRERIEQQGYTIIANIGDQQSDFTGAHAEREFRLPNPFYFIP